VLCKKQYITKINDKEEQKIKIMRTSKFYKNQYKTIYLEKNLGIKTTKKLMKGRKALNKNKTKFKRSTGNKE